MTCLAGKAIVVTGAGEGLGRAYAIACAAEGACVVVNDIDESAAEEAVRQITDRGGSAVAVVGSVASWEATEAMTEVCMRRFGQIDGLVANAAIMHTAAPWEETEENLRAIADVNVLGVQFAARHAMRAMVTSGRGGSIVTIVSGARLGIHGMSAYGASKGAVTAMTANWALEGEARGIRVNAVSPLGRTAMALRDRRPDRPEFPPTSAIAPVVVALLSDETRRVTGKVIRFDGSSMGEYTVGLENVAERASWSAVDAAATLNTLAAS